MSFWNASGHRCSDQLLITGTQQLEAIQGTQCERVIIIRLNHLIQVIVIYAVKTHHDPPQWNRARMLDVNIHIWTAPYLGNLILQPHHDKIPLCQVGTFR